MTTIRHSDLAAIKFCNRGAREFFARHGLDWSAFLRDGIEVERVQHIDDAMMRQVIQRAEQREQRGQS